MRYSNLLLVLYRFSFNWPSLIQRHLATAITHMSTLCLREFWGVLGNTLGLQKWNSFLQGYLLVYSCDEPKAKKKHTMRCTVLRQDHQGKINRNRRNVYLIVWVLAFDDFCWYYFFVSYEIWIMKVVLSLYYSIWGWWW